MQIPSELRHIEPEIRLGRAVIDQAVLDALEDDEALEWFSSSSDGFLDICQIAYLDITSVLNTFEKILPLLKDDS